MFKIDVGNMPSHLAMAFVERIKNEIHQRRIPSVYGGQCFAMDTMVPLLDGRTLSISDIADEFNQGKENWIYSCDPVTGKMVPGIVSWAGVTRKDSEVLELTLDNGKTIICTGDHKFPIQGKGFVEAKDIIINEDSLFSFNTRMHGINCDGKDNIDTDSQYHQVVSIRVLPQKIDVGTITVDGNEKYHNFHTFALEAGVYTKNSIVDATYNPLSMNEDYFFPVTADGRGSSVEMLAGGQNLGEIDDLRYFNNRLARGLRVPSSYLPTGPDDSDRVMNDGKVGTALIQEYRFNQYCERLQNYMSIKLDEEFKLFLRWRGFNIDSGLFKLTFNPPQNFAAYRQSELDKDRVATFQTVEALPYISKRFAMQRFLGLSEDEITKNEKLWEEENSKEKLDEPKGKDLRSIGVSTSDIESDMSTAEELGGEAEGGEPPPEVAGPVGGGAETSGAPTAPAGGAAGAPAGVPAPPAL
jgi:hypothetical protein